MSKTVYSSRYGALVLDSLLASGTEGDVYSVSNSSSIAVKLYHDGHCNEKTRRKIMAMVENRASISLPCQSQPQRRIHFASWPIDIVSDRYGKFIGFIMPRFYNTRSIICACRKNERVSAIPNYRFKDSVSLALNLALEVEHLHSQGIVLGDMNWKNIAFCSDLRVILFDTDSFTIKDRQGRIYKTVVGFEDMIPPELQGKDFREERNIFTKESDNFQLAILIWCLLMDNYHPFSGASASCVSSSSSCVSLNLNIARGNCPCLRGRDDLTSTGCPNFKKRIPLAGMQRGFTATFDYTPATAMSLQTIKGRTTASQWVKYLSEFYEYCTQNTISLSVPNKTAKKRVSVRQSNKTVAAFSPLTLPSLSNSRVPKNSAAFKETFRFILISLFSLLCTLAFHYYTKTGFTLAILDDFGLLFTLSTKLQLLLCLMTFIPVCAILNRNYRDYEDIFSMILLAALCVPCFHFLSVHTYCILYFLF